MEKDELQGHTARATRAGRVLAQSTTDGAGRFLLEWEDQVRDGVRLELLSRTGQVSEAVEVPGPDLVSPMVMPLSGPDLLGEPGRVPGGENYLRADGDAPVCVTSSCIPVRLEWKADARSTYSLLRDGVKVIGGLAPEGQVVVTEEGSHAYSLRPEGPEHTAEPPRVEVRRYHSMSLVVGEHRLRPGSKLEFGLSLCCPAPKGGEMVEVRSSDRNLAPDFAVVVPEGSSWAEGSVTLGAAAGQVSVVAHCPGYVRDEVVLVLK